MIGKCQEKRNKTLESKDKGKEKEWRSLGNKEKEIKKKKGERGGGID